LSQRTAAEAIWPFFSGGQIVPLAALLAFVTVLGGNVAGIGVAFAGADTGAAGVLSVGAAFAFDCALGFAPFAVDVPGAELPAAAAFFGVFFFLFGLFNAPSAGGGVSDCSRC
jgi:hypothetical protein